MTTEVEAHSIINAAAKAIVWPGRAPDLVLENVSKPTCREYVELDIQFLEATQATMGTEGTRRHDYHGVLRIAINTQVGVGTARATELAATARAAFESRVISDVLFRAASAPAKGVNGAWYFLVLKIPFVYYWHK